MPKVNFSCTYIARLLADKLTPEFNFKEQLWFIARANAKEATQYLCLLLRTQFHFQPQGEGESFFHDCFTDRGGADHEPFNAIISAQCAKEIAQRALILRDARQRLQNDPSPFPFLQLPYDIRLQIYDFVYINNQNLGTYASQIYSLTSEKTGCHWEDALELRASTGKFGTDINTALLLANRQIFNEAEPILYQTRFLNIGFHLVEGLQCLRNLSPRARQNIRAVHIALRYVGVSDDWWSHDLDDNSKAWCQLCDYMSQNLRLCALSFNACLKTVPVNFVDAVWVKHLIKIRGLKQLMQRKLEFDYHETETLEIYDNESAPSDDYYNGSWNDYESAPWDDYESASESASEPAPESHMVLDSRLQALQNYLESEMLQYPASRLLTEKEEV
ncbi:hypothetical protein JMJ35_007293 [Cladonia borealis]|uniref:Uncharacterized protein n=1 Tax=Cladonia borealis TaxID=184061 RepID=A0AA39QXS1_9LECA|nr:hypothetical protein JMJ35_007293 [Cladonia borealis]